MARASKLETSDYRASARAAGLICALALTAAMASGCKSTGEANNSKPPDVLFGEKEVPQPHGVLGPTPPPQNRAGMGAPSPPISTTAKGTAACLVPDPLIGAKPIAIADGKQPFVEPNTSGWQATGPITGGAPSSGGGPGVQLGMPEAALAPVPPPTIAQVTPVTPAFGGGKNDGLNPVPVVPAVSPVGFSDSDQLQAALKARGVIAQDQKVQPDGSVLFTCRVVNPQNPNFVRVYEATARDLRSAMLAVLDQIDQQR
ncbi:MAG TPA: hypothetical protein VE988_25230 [Gemmataceae bacterium]|nr:hypothetical protein [Gemmataceae bacterium]